MPRQEIQLPDHYSLHPACWVVLLIPAAIGAALALLFRTLWPAVLAIPALVTVSYRLISIAVATVTFAIWRVKGQRGLLVYSYSPNWQPYIEQNWLPRFGTKLRVLNWSERTSWNKRDSAVIIFHWFVGVSYNFNPAVVLLRPFRRPLVFRFYPAFKNAKHGNVDGLKQLESRLFAELRAI